jgi:hypothetical protein
MSNPQKAKGSSWERDCANFLTKIYGETFIRAPGSGAYVGGTNNKRKQFLHENQIRSFKGDIVPGQSFPKMNVECKSYKDFPFHQLLHGNCKQLDTWLAQLLDAEDAGDFSILMMKFNRKGAYIAVRHSLLAQLNLPQNYLINSSDKHGSWLIIEHDTFWSLNKDTVKTLCQ